MLSVCSTKYELHPRLKAWGIAERTLLASKFERETAGRMLYHVWFGTKNRKWLLLEDVENAAKEYIRQVAAEKEIRLLECETMVDHIHLLLEAAPKELPETMRLLKGGSAYKVFRQFPELKLDAKTKNFWQVRYAAKPVSESGKAAATQYIRIQKDRPEKFER